jgi:hypothetical protein
MTDPSLIDRERCEPEAGILAPRRRGAIPCGFLGMVAMILAIESWVARNWRDFSDPVSLSWRFSAHAAATRAPESAVVCLGDSLVKHGIFPAVLERATGRRSVNLSAARGPTLLSYFLLRRALGAGARPDALVINAKPAVLIGGPDYDMRYWQEVVTPRESLDLLQMTGRLPLVASICLGRLVPTLRARLEIQSNVQAALRGEADRLHAINRVLWRNWTVNAGGNVTAANSPYAGAVTSDVESQLHTSLFHVDPTNAVAIERLLKLAAQHKTRVFWLMTPLAPKLQALRDESGAEARYEQFVRSLQARSPQVMTVLDARRAGYPSALFVDPTHLSGSGGIALSRSVGTAIDAELAHSSSARSAAWIALDPPSAAPTGLVASLEDLERSQRILGLAASAHESSP